jgi:enamine deaminase RidA (YjgF/YER057c/UK114 family)
MDRMTRNALKSGLTAMALLLAGSASAAEVSRTGQPNRPFSTSVTVPAGSDLIFLSGEYPPVIDASAPKGSVQQYGDTATQTAGALTTLQTTLKGLGLTLGDVVQAHAFLVGDPDKNGEIDFAGFQSGWARFFGTSEQPNKPTRSAVKVAGLVSRGVLVEIELVAARAKPSKN